MLLMVMVVSKEMMHLQKHNSRYLLPVKQRMSAGMSNQPTRVGMLLCEGCGGWY